MPPDNIGFILVVEAALGKSDVVQLCKGSLIERGYQSRKANGEWKPDDTPTPTGWPRDPSVTIPSGKTVPQKLNGLGTFQYNEYVLFDPRLYRLRYLLVLKQRPLGRH